MRLKITLLSLFCLSLTAQAEIPALPDTVFLHFPASENRVVKADDMPEVSYSQQLTYLTEVQAQIVYPEYAALTASELEVAKKAHLPEGLQPQVNVSCCRKQAIADVVFCPIVRFGDTYKRLVSCKIVLTEVAGKQRVKAADNKSRYAEKSVLSSGKWVKIHVSSEGVYELTAATLKKWGFEDISKVKVYGYGGRILPEKLVFEGNDALIDDLTEVPCYRGKKTSLLFWAEGPVKWDYSYTLSTPRYVHTDNYYSQYSYYFVTEGTSPMQMETLEETADVEKTVSQVPHYALYDGNAFNWYGGGRTLFDSYDFAATHEKTYKIATPDVVASSVGYADISVGASSALSSTTFTIKVQGKLMGTATAGAFGSNEDARVSTVFFNTTNLQAQNSFYIQTNNDNAARLDYIRVNYTRQLNGQATPFAFQTGASDEVKVSVANADAGTQIWKLGRGATPIQNLSGTLSNGNFVTKTALGMNDRYALVNVAKSYSEPQLDGEVKTQNLHAHTATDMVIVIPESGKLTEQAERLAQLHRDMDKMRVKVVKANEIYNEFSSGTPDATAIRRYMKMLYDRAETDADMPQYLLLMGSCNWDNRMLTSDMKQKNKEDYLLVYEVNGSNNSVGTVYSYCTDDYYGFLDDGEGSNIRSEKLDLSIGRLLCLDADEAKIMVDKIVAYRKNKSVGAWKNRILMMGDDGDANEHMEDAERVTKVINDNTNRAFTIQKDYWDAYSRTTAATGFTYPQVTSRIKDQWQRGVVLANYSGHGSPHQISHSFLLLEDDFNNVTDRLPLWVLASCEIYPIDQEEENMGHIGMLNPNGGAIGFMCATRAVYATQNNILNRHYCSFVFGKDDNGKRYTMGDALRLAKIKLVTTSGDLTMNKMKYVLIGDPALALSIPTRKVVIDSLNGKPVGETIQQIKGGSSVKFSGHVLNDNEGGIDETFNGSLTATLFDREETITCKNNSGSASKAMTYVDRPNQIFEGNTPVKNGRFDILLTLPLDISYSNDAARLQMYAVSNDSTLECNGYFEDICLNGTDPSVLTDTLAPKVFLFMNGDEEFPDGGSVAQSTLFCANISDNLGINASGLTLGHDIELTIDDDPDQTYKLNNNFAYDFGSSVKGSVTYELNDLTFGPHVASLRVWDVNNNFTLGKLNFVVRPENEIDDAFGVSLTHNMTGTGTNIVVRTRDGDTNDIEVRVYASNGQYVWGKIVPAGVKFVSVGWNLTDGGGAALPAGLYLVSAKQGKKESRAKKLVIQRQ